ncbi:MAG: hypothetical protein JNK87_04190 [Bryobacterales bacterium]|nr:hypothetical protein [Bryobacterales bacterium]
MSVFLPVFLITSAFVTQLQAAPIVALFDPLTLQPASALAVPAVPNSLAFGNNSLYAASSAGLARYTPAGSLVALLSPPGLFLFSNVTFDTYVYAAIELSGTRVISRIIDFDNSSFMQQPFVPLTAMPLALARASQQTFAAFPHELAQYDAAGQLTAFFSPATAFLFHPLASYQSQLYAAITSEGATRLSAVLQVADASLTEIVLASLPGVPTALAAGAGGLYAAFSGGVLHRYGFDGTLLATHTDPTLSFTAAAIGPDFLYVAADSTAGAEVPEPTSLTMACSMLLLFALLRARRS